MKIIVVVLMTALCLYASCSDEGSDTSATISCTGVTVSFETDVQPLIQSSCASRTSCHGSGSTESPGELLTYAQIYSARSRIRSAVASGSMPRNGSLTTNQKQIIICWIDGGAGND